VGKLVDMVQSGKQIGEDELRTVQQVILNRENFKVGYGEWIKNIMISFGCCCPLDRKDKLFKKGIRKIKLDLDLRTYIKSIRHIQILHKVLFTERQRNLLNFQKAKVLESGSTSASEDFYYEPAIALRNPDTELYLKKHHADQINGMLKGYNKNSIQNDEDARLFFGIATNQALTE